MKSRNRHQMVGAGARKALPIVCGDRALEAGGQCNHNAGMRSARQYGFNVSLLCVPPACQKDRQAVRVVRFMPRRRISAHCANRAQIAFEHHGFKVRAVRVRAAVRTFEPYRKLPAFSGAKSRQRRVVTRVPVELNEARHGLNRDALICEAFDFKYKTRMAGVDNWNAANNASHTQIAAFQRVWQKTRQAKMGAPGGSAITR